MKLSGFRIIPPLERYEWLVDFVQKTPGKILLLMVFALVLLLHQRPTWIEITGILALLSFFPQHRRVLLLLSTTYWLFSNTNFFWYHVTDIIQLKELSWSADDPILRTSAIAASILFCALFFNLAVKLQDHFVMRRPVMSLFVVYFTLVLSITYFPLPVQISAGVWIFLIVFGHYFWYLAYSLLDRRNARTDGFIWQFRSYAPFWMEQAPTPLPVPKGLAYLRRIEAKDSRELAICQLKGIKLLFWAFILQLFKTVFDKVLFNYSGIYSHFIPDDISLNLPIFLHAFRATVEGNAFPWYINWISLFTQLLQNVLTIAVTGHIMIAIVRMAGFNALRSTYKPLASSSLAEYWNRYFYYFKELLVEFFFYPTYTRYFKQYPKIRLFFATLMAAGFGNVLFHFIIDIKYVLQMGFIDAIISFHVYMFYGLVLGTAIGISQLRLRSRTLPLPWWREKITAPAGVILFYCFVLIFDAPDRTLTILDNFTFVMSLFGM